MMTTGVDPWNVYAAVAVEIRPVMNKHGYAINNCISASLLGQAALRHYGIDSELVPVGLLVGNAEAMKAIEASNGKPQKWEKDSKAWTVAISTTGAITSTGWDGHLVVQTEDNVLLDLSLDQTSRPEKDLLVAPLVYPLEGPALRSWSDDGRISITNGLGQFIHYDKIFGTKAQNYKQSGDWRRGVSAGALLDLIARVNVRLDLPEHVELTAEEKAELDQMISAGPEMGFIIERDPGKRGDGLTFSADAIEGAAKKIHQYIGSQIMAHWQKTGEPAQRMKIIVSVETES